MSDEQEWHFKTNRKTLSLTFYEGEVLKNYQISETLKTKELKTLVGTKAIILLLKKVRRKCMKTCMRPASRRWAQQSQPS